MDFLGTSSKSRLNGENALLGIKVLYVFTFLLLPPNTHKGKDLILNIVYKVMTKAMACRINSLLSLDSPPYTYKHNLSKPANASMRLFQMLLLHWTGIQSVEHIM